MKRAHRIIHDEAGSSLVETALSLIVLLTTILAIIYFSVALYTYEFVSYAAQQGTRYAIVRGAHWTGITCSSTTTQDCDATTANVTSYVQSLATPGITASQIVVTPAWPGKGINASTVCTTTNSDGCLISVKVSYSFSLSLPLVPGSLMHFTATSEEAIQE